MKKIIALAVALMMVMALSVSVFADDVLFEFKGNVSVGWGTILNGGSDEAKQFVEAIQKDGAVITMTGVNLTEDQAGADYYFQVASQDQVSWQGSAVVSENIGEEYNFTDGGYTITVPGKAFYDAIVAGGYDVANAGIILNGGNWNVDTTDLILTVTVGAAAEAAPAEAEAAPAETTEAAPAETTEAAPAETAPAATTAAPNTGIALAVIPAVMALAAVAVSKKH